MLAIRTKLNCACNDNLTFFNFDRIVPEKNRLKLKMSVSRVPIIGSSWFLGNGLTFLWRKTSEFFFVIWPLKGGQITSCLFWTIWHSHRCNLRRWFQKCYLKIPKVEIWPLFALKRGQITSCLLWTIWQYSGCSLPLWFRKCYLQIQEVDIWPLSALKRGQITSCLLWTIWYYTGCSLQRWFRKCYL